MSEKYILISIVVAVIAIVFIALVLIVKNSTKTVVIREKKREKSDSYSSKPSYTIKDMVEIAAKRESSRDELKRAIDIVKKDIPFPKKVGYKLPKDIKIYLNFILLIASHKNADAKLIAYMDEELKKSNPQYRTEIEIYENEGLHERSKRI